MHADVERDGRRGRRRLRAGARRRATGATCDFVSRLYRYEMRDFIDRNLDSPLDLLDPVNLARLVALGGFAPAGPEGRRSYLQDDRTRRVFSFQAMYAGLSPYDALAIYAVIAYMDSVAGVFFPRGGMHAVPTRAGRGGAEARGRVPVRHRGRAGSSTPAAGPARCSPRTASGSGCDVVVLNPDLPVAYRDLLGLHPAPGARGCATRPSCVLLLAGSRAAYVPGSRAPHIHFGQRLAAASSTELIERPADERPVGAGDQPDPVATPALAPPGRQIYYVLVPTPNLDRPASTGTGSAPRYREHVLATLDARGYPGFGDAIEVEHRHDPARTGRPAGWSAARRSPPRTPSGRPGRSGRATCWGENVVVRRLRHPARRRGADGADLRAARGRADHRAGPRLPLPGLAVSGCRPVVSRAEHPVSTSRSLDAAGITDPQLRGAYEACRRLHAAHGKTYYLATLLLPPRQAPARLGAVRLRPLRGRVRRLAAPRRTPHALLEWGVGVPAATRARATREDPIGAGA